ncbi:MAG: alpha/beta fold hydrolase, partial [Patescibacteria group bacterium]
MEIAALLRGALAFPSTLGSAVLHEGRNIPKWLLYNLIGDWLDYYDTHNGYRGVIYLVPGVAETYLAMVPLANFLHRRGFNVRIFPKGTYTPTVEDGANIVSQRVQEARQHFQHHRFILIGHSWGAAVAAAVNRRHGDVVDLCLALALPSLRTPLALPAAGPGRTRVVRA